MKKLSVKPKYEAPWARDLSVGVAWGACDVGDGEACPDTCTSGGCATSYCSTGDSANTCSQGGFAAVKCDSGSND